jgi:hypothetical protein
MNNDQSTQDPATIERDILRTQDDMSRTVDKLGDQLTVKNVFNALLDKADENGIDAHYLLEGARRNPIALGLIAAGAIWLVSDKDSKFPSLSTDAKEGGADDFDAAGHDLHHRDYVTHMSSIEMRDGESPSDYQRRRDMHRATFLMCEPKPDEDDQTFRQRLDDMTDSFRQKRRAWMDAAGETSSAAVDKTQQLTSRATSRVQDLYEANPLIGGLAAAVVGLALGSTLPVTETEQENLGEIGGKARGALSEQKDQFTSMAMEKKDELLDKADESLRPQGQQGSGRNPQQTEPALQGSEQAQQPQQRSGEQRSASDGPFIISEKSL